MRNPDPDPTIGINCHKKEKSKAWLLDDVFLYNFKLKFLTFKFFKCVLVSLS